MTIAAPREARCLPLKAVVYLLFHNGIYYKMASSSVSQESLDREDYEFSARKSRVRALRTRAPVSPHPKPPDPMGLDTAENGDDIVGIPGVHNAGVHTGVDHDSPTRMASRLKEKRGRPNHLHHNKGKTAKDKRKLREKRRSTGVIHMPSTEVSINANHFSVSDVTFIVMIVFHVTFTWPAGAL